MKFVVNTCYGGFGLSSTAVDRLIELGLQPAVSRIDGETDENYRHRAYVNQMRKNRFHPLLVQVVEELGAAVNSQSSDLKIAIYNPEDLQDILIDEHDGQESVKWPAHILYES